MNRLGYSFRDGIRLVSRNLLANVLTVFTATAVFFVIGVGLLLVLNMRNAITTMGDQLTVHAYLYPATDASTVFKTALKYKNVREAQIVNKQKAMERLRARMGNSEVLSLLSDNPLPNSVEIKVTNVAAVSSVAKKLESLQGVEEVIYAGKVADKLTKISDFVNHLSMVLLVIAVLASGIVIFNTVKLSIYAKSEEIKVMLLVGATPAYIAFPYVLQGMILGLLGSFLALSLLVGSYCLALGKLRELLPFLQFVDISVLTVKLGFLLLACGVAVSLIASCIAIENFIRRASKPR